MADRVAAALENPCVVFSKSYCPYCDKVKDLFTSLGANFTVIELDQMDGGDAIHTALKQKISKTSVPQVFINKNHIGGCDDTMALHSAGKLQEQLKAASAL